MLNNSHNSIICWQLVFPRVGVKLLPESAVTYYMGPSMGGQIITSMGGHLLNRTFDDGHY